MVNDGKQLTETEAHEFLAYSNAGIAPPDRFDGVVIDATDPRGIVYRHPTAAEVKADREATAMAEKAASDDAALAERVRAEAAKRGVSVPEAPAPPEMPKA